MDNACLVDHIRTCIKTKSLRKWIFNFTLLKYGLISDSMHKLWNTTLLNVENLKGWERHCGFVKNLSTQDKPKLQCLKCNHIMLSIALGNCLPHLIMCLKLSINEKLDILSELLQLYKFEYTHNNHLTIKHPIKVQNQQESWNYDIEMRHKLIKQQQDTHEHFIKECHLKVMETRERTRLCDLELQLLREKRLQ